MLRLAVTPGEPAGIGPELLLRVAHNRAFSCELVAIADHQLLQQTVRELGLTVNLKPFEPNNPQASGLGNLSVHHVPLNSPCHPGKLNASNAPYVLETLRLATQGCLRGDFRALVTGPVHKGIINDAGIHFTGHTEYLAQQSQVKQVVMMLACEGLRVALATTHLPLRDVADAIQPESLRRTLEILHTDLVRQFGVSQPNILICGLNPHAGEGGHMGREEIDVIAPVINQLRQEYGWQLSDPLPADTLFTPRHLASVDAVLAMYHDQGLPVLKFKGFGAAVNITLGLPFIRTSVDHGTALDLVGQGQANTGSLETALDYAVTMAQSN